MKLKIRDYAMVILLNGFIGYLFVLFIQNLDTKITSLGARVVLFMFGVLFFGEIVNRLEPLSRYKFFHPIRLAAFVSTLAVVLLYGNYVGWDT